MYGCAPVGVRCAAAAAAVASLPRLSVPRRCVLLSPGASRLSARVLLPTSSSSSSSSLSSGCILPDRRHYSGIWQPIARRPPTREYCIITSTRVCIIRILTQCVSHMPLCRGCFFCCRCIPEVRRLKERAVARESERPACTTVRTPTIYSVHCQGERERGEQKEINNGVGEIEGRSGRESER